MNDRKRAEYYATNEAAPTPVIVRLWPNGDAIALFPATPATPDPLLCNSYEPVGQHGAACPGLVLLVTKPWTSERAGVDLVNELRQIGYGNLEFRQRIRPWMREARILALNETESVMTREEIARNCPQLARA